MKWGKKILKDLSSGMWFHLPYWTLSAAVLYILTGRSRDEWYEALDPMTQEAFAESRSLVLF